MKLLRAASGVAATLTLLVLGVPLGGAGAAPDASPSSQERGQGEQHRAEVVPRKRPTTPASSPAPQSNARARQVTCGQVITQNTVLRNDVGPCPGDGIVIGADNIFLNLNGHRVLGNSDQGAGGEFAGIRLLGRTGVTVTGHPGGQSSGHMATVSGFEAGVVIDGGSANTVQNLVVRDNIGRDDFRNAELGDGIFVWESPSNRILNNVVVHNGIFDGIGVLGSASDNTTIQGNSVENTVGPADGGPAGQGIIVNGADGVTAGAITGTNTEGNIVRRNASAGLANMNNTEARIVDNTVEDNGFTNAQGNGIGVQTGFGFRAPAHVLVEGNEVHGNAWNGIVVAWGTRENRIINNDAANNDALSDSSPGPFFDLRDENRPTLRWYEEWVPADCDNNVWQGNTWGSGFYFPECVTAGGSGPALSQSPEGPYGDPTCSDQWDNDQNGIIDGYDPGCERPPPEPEGPEGDPTCSDGVDNDQDGYTDGVDPDCDDTPFSEGSEFFGTCMDGNDNDKDGLVDLADPDCGFIIGPPGGPGGPGGPITETPQLPGPGGPITETPQLPGPGDPITETPQLPGPGDPITETPQLPGPGDPITETPQLP